jgi:hypothetical protein
MYYEDNPTKEIRIKYNSTPSDGYSQSNNIYIGGGYTGAISANDFVIGHSAKNTKFKNVLIGNTPQNTSSYSTTIGFGTQVNRSYRTVIGYYAKGSTNSITICAYCNNNTADSIKFCLMTNEIYIQPQTGPIDLVVVESFPIQNFI